MCKFCEKNNEGDIERRDDPEMEYTRSYTEEYDSGWTLTSVYDDRDRYQQVEISIYYCPFCGRELD